MAIREPPRQPYDNFKPFKTFWVNRGGLWVWPKSKLYCSRMGLIRSDSDIVDVFVVIRGRSGGIMNTVRGGGRGATGLNNASTVTNRGRILSICSSPPASV